jgi:monoamine oxidase
MAREADVVIVGAGLSGLIAARDVLTAGYEPLILEADQRVGGRILTEDVEGVPLELGAQWIGDTHHRMAALASELGVGIYPQFEDGETSYEFGGEVLREQAFRARYGGELSGVEHVLRTLDQMADTVPAEAPWLAPEADAWDRMTAGQWYDSQGLSRVARTLLEICTVGILAVPTVEVSLLCLLFNVAVCGVTADLLAESEGGRRPDVSSAGPRRSRSGWPQRWEIAFCLGRLCSRSTTQRIVSWSPAAVAWPLPDARLSWHCRLRWRDGSCTILPCPACGTS